MPPTVKPSSETAASFVHVSVVRIASAASAPPSARERGNRLLQARDDAVERQQRTDHAGREDEHLLGLEVEQPAGLGCRRDRVEQAALAGGGVRDARVDDDRLRLRGGEVLLRHDHGRGLDAVDRLHRRPDRRHGRAHDGEVLRAPPDARVNARGDEALGGRDAHTRTPREPEARPSRRARARGSRSAPPGRRRPCRGCRARRRRSTCRSNGR